MSGTRAFPSFGIRGKPKNIIEESNDGAVKLQVVDLKSYKQNIPGDLVLNKDNLVYYNTGDDWVPLASANESTELLENILSVDNKGTTLALEKGNLALRAGQAKTGCDLYLSSGRGVLNSGNVHINAGDKTVIKVSDKNVALSGDLIFNEPTMGLTPFVLQSTIEADGDELPNVKINAKTFVLSIKLSLSPNTTLIGTIDNKCVSDDSWVSVTAVGDANAVPYVWVNPNNGSLMYYLRSLDGILRWVQLHIDVR